VKAIESISALAFSALIWIGRSGPTAPLSIGEQRVVSIAESQNN
jgi:hypothetical protein